MGRISDLVEERQGPENDLVLAAGRAGLLPRITSTIRSNSEQRRLYNRYLAGQAGYPVAPPGYSAHEYGLAFDMVVSPMEALADVGYTWQQWDGGGNGAAAVHFELPGASEYAREQGRLLEVQSDSAGATAAGFITTATDFYLGSKLAGLFKILPPVDPKHTLHLLR